MDRRIVERVLAVVLFIAVAFAVGDYAIGQQMNTKWIGNGGGQTVSSSGLFATPSTTSFFTGCSFANDSSSGLLYVTISGAIGSSPTSAAVKPGEKVSIDVRGVNLSTWTDAGVSVSARWTCTLP